MRVEVARILSLAAAALAALSIGCGPPPGPQAPVQPVAQITPAPAPRSQETAPPEPAKVELLKTRDDLVRVVRPAGEGWECQVELVGAARVGMRASYAQCIRKTAQGAISLMAKDYEVPRAFVMSAEALSTIEYPKHYKKRWDQVKYTRSGPVDHHGYPAYEVVIELGRKDGTKSRIVERVLVVGTHTLNLSAQAPPEMLTRFEADVKRWFDGAEFAALEVDPMHQAALPAPFELAGR